MSSFDLGCADKVSKSATAAVGSRNTQCAQILINQAKHKMYVLSKHNMHSWSSPFIVCRYGFMATGKLVTPYTVCQSAPAGAMNHYADDVGGNLC